MGILLFGGASLARASVIINEVAWMGTSVSSANEWVELYNDSSSSEDLSGWILKTGDNDISITLAGSVSAKGFYLIERTDDTTVPDIPADLIATFGHGLSNDGEVLILKNNTGTDVDTLSFLDGWPAGDNTTKESMQKSSLGWITAIATPKAENYIPPSGGGGLVGAGLNENNTSTQTNSSTSAQSTIKSTTPVIKTKIIAKNLAFLGLPITMQASATGYSGGPMYSGKYFWNFGDGDSKEVKIEDNQNFSHTYFYPGEYMVTLEYYVNYFSNTPDASDKLVIKVIPADISISAVGDEKDFFVVLSNNSVSDADISGWALRGEEKSFIFPKNTILQSKSKLILSPRITGFTVLDKNSLKLMTQDWATVYDYSSPTPKKLAIKTEQTLPPANIEPANALIPENTVLSSDLSASVLESNPSSNSYLWISGFVILLVISSGVVWFIRRGSKVPPNPVSGDEFEMLDE
jgi:hypothetical protein